MSNDGVTPHAGAMTTVGFDAPGLGDRSYLVTDGEVGVVIDPQRDPFRYIQEAKTLGVAITVVLETHIHNDYVSGGLALARATGATYVIPAGEPVSFTDECRFLDDGDTIATGRLEVTAIATAGHTAHHLSYLLELAADDDGGAPRRVVCTGGSLLVNATGRTDLLGPALAETLAHLQWRSVRRLLTTIPEDTRVLPTHGFGSFCSSTPASGDSGASPTIGQELTRNPAALLEEEAFVATLLRDPLPIPAYYRHMAPLNRQGPSVPSFEPVPEIDAGGLQRAIRRAEWVVDLRQRRDFAAGHLKGTLNLELGANLATYLGWIVPWEGRLVLIANEDAEIDEARRLIACIGRDELSGTALWQTAITALGGARLAGNTPLCSYRVASFADLAEAWPDRTDRPHLLDVRHRYEWRGGHLRGARHLALPELPASRPDVPTTAQVWVHCGAGFRAAVAASLLSRWGASPVLIDDTWTNAELAGLPIVTEDD